MEDLLGLSFTPADLDALIAWSESAALRGVASDLETRCEAVQETFPVTMPGSDEPHFSLWPTQGGTYCLEDWRVLGQDDDNVETIYAALGVALRAIETKMAKCGRALPRVVI